MSQMQPYKRGYRDALRWSVTWLHARAAEMNDPQCKAFLNSAATNLGWDIEKKMALLIEPITSPEQWD